MQKEYGCRAELNNLPVNFESFDLSQKIFITILTVFFVAVAFCFVTAWLDLEKRSRARRFCLFVCLGVFFNTCCGNFKVTFMGKYSTDSLVASLITALISIPITWLLGYCYNFSEYFIIIGGLMATRGLLWLTSTLATGRPFKSNLIDLFTVIVLVIAVWNRKKYLATYKIGFACLISLSGLSSAAVIAQEEKILAIIVAFLVVGSSGLVAIVGKNRVAPFRSMEAV